MMLIKMMAGITVYRQIRDKMECGCASWIDMVGRNTRFIDLTKRPDGTFSLQCAKV